MLLTAAFLAATEGWVVPRKVLNISSGLGRRAIASRASYCAAKAGMDHFSRSVALDEALKPHGARICSLAPGVIDTGMQLQLRSADASAFPDAGNFAQLKDGGQLTSRGGGSPRAGLAGAPRLRRTGGRRRAPTLTSHPPPRGAEKKAGFQSRESGAVFDEKSS